MKDHLPTSPQLSSRCRRLLLRLHTVQAPPERILGHLIADVRRSSRMNREEFANSFLMSSGVLYLVEGGLIPLDQMRAYLLSKLALIIGIEPQTLLEACGAHHVRYSPVKKAHTQPIVEDLYLPIATDT